MMKGKKLDVILPSEGALGKTAGGSREEVDGDVAKQMEVQHRNAEKKPLNATKDMILSEPCKNCPLGYGHQGTFALVVDFVKEDQQTKLLGQERNHCVSAALMPSSPGERNASQLQSPVMVVGCHGTFNLMQGENGSYRCLSNMRGFVFIECQELEHSMLHNVPEPRRLARPMSVTHSSVVQMSVPARNISRYHNHHQTYSFGYKPQLQLKPGAHNGCSTVRYFANGLQKATADAKDGKPEGFKCYSIDELKMMNPKMRAIKK